MKTYAVLLLFFFGTFLSYAQKNLNAYKYVIVPKEFSFLTEKNQYQLNALAKFLLEKEHFEVLYNNEILPEDLISNRCLALNFVLNKTSSMLKTKLQFKLINCKNQFIFSSNEGSSKIKNYKKAYHESLRNAFKSLHFNNHKFDSSLIKTALLVKPESKIIVNKTKVVFKDKTQETTRSNEDMQLYAEATGNGFKLVNKTKVPIYNILNTNLKNVFFVKKGYCMLYDNAILYKSESKWYLEFYIGAKLNKKLLKIEF